MSDYVVQMVCPFQGQEISAIDELALEIYLIQKLAQLERQKRKPMEHQKQDLEQMKKRVGL